MPSPLRRIPKWTRRQLRKANPGIDNGVISVFPRPASFRFNSVVLLAPKDFLRGHQAAVERKVLYPQHKFFFLPQKPQKDTKGHKSLNYCALLWLLACQVIRMVVQNKSRVPGVFAFSVVFPKSLREKQAKNSHIPTFYIAPRLLTRINQLSQKPG